MKKLIIMESTFILLPEETKKEWLKLATDKKSITTEKEEIINYILIEG